jgi:hypothetical protein
MVAPPWLPGTRVVEQREILASRLQKAATEPAENSSQFAVWSLNVVLFNHIKFILQIIIIINL